jgi:hypothetical protein
MPATRPFDICHYLAEPIKPANKKSPANFAGPFPVLKPVP